MKFYAGYLPDHCCEHNRCGAKASHAVRGPFNAHYGYVCAKHVEARLSDLERVHVDDTTGNDKRLGCTKGR